MRGWASMSGLDAGLGSALTGLHDGEAVGIGGERSEKSPSP